MSVDLPPKCLGEACMHSRCFECRTEHVEHPEPDVTFAAPPNHFDEIQENEIIALQARYGENFRRIEPNDKDRKVSTYSLVNSGEFQVNQLLRRANGIVKFMSNLLTRILPSLLL